MRTSLLNWLRSSRNRQGALESLAPLIGESLWHAMLYLGSVLAHD